VHLSEDVCSVDNQLDYVGENEVDDEFSKILLVSADRHLDRVGEDQVPDVSADPPS